MEYRSSGGCLNISEKIGQIASNFRSNDSIRRVNAQGQLASIQSTREWLELVFLLEGTPTSLLRVIHQNLCDFILNVRDKEEMENLLSKILASTSPFSQNDVWVEHILQSFNKSLHFSARIKAEIVTQLFKSSRLITDYSECALVYLLRIATELRATRALNSLPDLILHPSDFVVFEAIQFIREAQDPRATTYLELLFNSERLDLAMAAIYAYGEIGVNSLKGLWQLYSFYLRSPVEVRAKVLDALPLVRPNLMARLIGFTYLREKDLQLKAALIKKISQLRHVVSVRCLVWLFRKEENTKLRLTIEAALKTVPAWTAVKVLSRELSSKDQRLQEWAILKCSELPRGKAFQLLAPFLKGKKTLASELHPTMLQSVANITSKQWVSGWLAGHIGDSFYSTITAITLISKRSFENCEFLENWDRLSTAELQWMLASIQEHATRLSGKATLKLCTLIKHENYLVRYFSARILLLRKDQKLFAVVWALGEREKGRQQQGIAKVVSSNLGIGLCPLRWLPMTKTSFLRQVIKYLQTPVTTLEDWEGLITKSKGVGEPFTTLIERQRYAWTQQLKTALLNEEKFRGVEVLKRMLAHFPDVVPPDIWVQVLDKLKSNKYKEPQGVLELLSWVKGIELSDSYIEWLTSLRKEEEIRVDGLRTLAQWLRSDNGVVHG